MDHPLQETLSRLAEFLPAIPATTVPVGGGWMRLHDLLSEAEIVRLLGEQDVHHGGGPALAAQSLVGRLGGQPTILASAAVFAEDRLPLVTREELAVRWVDEGHGPRLGAVAFTGGRMAVLPDDPAAGLEGVEIVPDRSALHARLLAMVLELFEPLVAEVSRVGRRGRRALWQALADRVGSGFLQAGKHLDAATRARLDAAATLAAAPRPLRVTHEWLEIVHDERRYPFLRKSVCCLVYKGIEHHGRYCDTCPLLDRDESTRRLRAAVADGT